MARTPTARRNFKHQPSRKTVEISFEEYTHNKNEILSKIYNRLFWLACLATTFGLIELVLYIIIDNKYSNVLAFRKPILGVPLKSIYMIYWGACSLVCAHGYHLHFTWRHVIQDGTHLVMHCRLFEIIGLLWIFTALWLMCGIFSAFGFIDWSIIGVNMENIMYAVALTTLSLNLVICPWFFKTIHSKTTQIDDIFGAEFLGKTKFKQVNVEPLTDLNDIPSDNDSDVSNHDENESEASEAKSSEEEVRGPALVQFQLDIKRTMKKTTFWELWKSTDVAGSFSCNFKNKPPTLNDVIEHLKQKGFHVVSNNTSKDIIEIFLYGYQINSNVNFLAEFIFVYPRQFFQTTFKYESKDIAANFVKCFELHQLMDTDE